MLNITPKMQSSLGRAVILYGDGVLYITNIKGWMLVIPSPDAWIPHQVIEVVHSCANETYQALDWRVLNAKTVDFANKKFLPYRARKHAPLLVNAYELGNNTTAERAKKTAEDLEDCIFGDLVDLEAIFAGGEARAIYKDDPKVLKRTGRAFAKDENAEVYIFNFDDKALALHGAQFRAFREMGFQAFCPKRRLGHWHSPPVGLRLSGGYDIIGFMMPQVETSIFEDLQGRRLFVDAGRASWRTQEESLQGLRDPHSYSFDREGNPRSLGDLLDESWGHEDLKLDVSSLMWKGWSVEDINQAYEEGRAPAYEQKAHIIQVTVAKRVEELEDENTPTWRLRNISNELERFCSEYESMGRLVELDLGLLPQAIELLRMQDVERAEEVENKARLAFYRGHM